jgi:hypothetical protein
VGAPRARTRIADRDFSAVEHPRGPAQRVRVDGGALRDDAGRKWREEVFSMRTIEESPENDRLITVRP